MLQHFPLKSFGQILFADGMAETKHIWYLITYHALNFAESLLCQRGLQPFVCLFPFWNQLPWKACGQKKPDQYIEWFVFPWIRNETKQKKTKAPVFFGEPVLNPGTPTTHMLTQINEGLSKPNKLWIWIAIKSIPPCPLLNMENISQSHLGVKFSWKETEGSLENMSATCLDKVAVADVSSRQLPLFAVLLKQSNAQQKLGTL